MGDRYMEENRFHDASLMEIRQAPRQFAAVEYVELLADEVMRQDFELDRLRAENAALRLDAERYRCLRNQAWLQVMFNSQQLSWLWIFHSEDDRKSMDTAIDAERDGK